MTTMDYELEAKTFLKETGTKLQVIHTGYGPYFDDDKESRDIYRFTLRRNGKSYTGRFGASLVMTREGRKPTEYDILSCLIKNDPGTFSDFCGDFGYSDDSRWAERTYKGVVKEWQGVSRLFSGVLDKLQDIQ